MNNLSDDARSMACPCFSGDLEKQEAWMDGFTECRRRAEAMLEERERKAFEAGWQGSYRWVRIDDAPGRDEAFSAYQAAQEKAQ